jgi:hypothetical protein
VLTNNNPTKGFFYGDPVGIKWAVSRPDGSPTVLTANSPIGVFMGASGRTRFADLSTHNIFRPMPSGGATR